MQPPAQPCEEAFCERDRALLRLSLPHLTVLGGFLVARLDALLDQDAAVTSIQLTGEPDDVELARAVHADDELQLDVGGTRGPGDQGDGAGRPGALRLGRQGRVEVGQGQRGEGAERVGPA